VIDIGAMRACSLRAEEPGENRDRSHHNHRRRLHGDHRLQEVELHVLRSIAIINDTGEGNV
jgi:hypothetical protein